MSAFEPTEETITLHGLGFLQVKLGGKQRLHVWHPMLPRRRCFADSQIHDHRFGFHSRVLVGQQNNTQYRHTLAVDGAFMSYLHEGARTQFGNRPWIPDGALDLEPWPEERVEAGDAYTMRPYVYHSTRPGGDGRVATLMTKTSEGGRGAHSTCRVDVEPDADFDRKAWPPGLLWEIAKEVLGHG